MRGDEIEPNWDHPQKHIVGVHAGSPPPSLPVPHPLFKASALCEDPLGRLWHLKECDARACMYVCVFEGTRAHVCMQRR